MTEDERQEQIRQLEEEIDCMGFYDFSDQAEVARQRIVARLASALADLKRGMLLGGAHLAQEQPQRKRLNNGQCAAQIVDCDCRWCSPEPTRTVANNVKAGRIIGLEERERLLRDALSQFVDHFGDPFRNARAALGLIRDARTAAPDGARSDAND